MGGGPLSQALEQKAKQRRVVMSASAALTVHHDPQRVRSSGIEVVDDAEAENLARSGAFSRLKIGDLQYDRLERMTADFGVPFRFEAVCVCAQDHGRPPAGMSHLDYRHNLFRAVLDANPVPSALLYEAAEVPSTFNRLRCIARSAQKLPAKEVYVMDSGMAAILGASMDSAARLKRIVLTLDVATSHTVGAVLDGMEIAAFFEYQTHDVILERLETLIRDLADGKLEHRTVLKEGGHGAYKRRAVGYDAVEVMIATGPKRGMLARSETPFVFGAPLGDNMMTGTVGMLEALRRRKGIGPFGRH